MEAIGAIVLAAGNSSRLGEPKQLLLHQGRNLVQRAAEIAAEAGCAPVCVVLGANAERIRQEIGDVAAQTVFNREWEFGIGTSIRCGVEACLGAEPALTGLVILVCDQPFLDAALIRALRAQSDRGIAAAAYGDTLGVPALFTRPYFPALRSLPDDRGAKHLLEANAHDVAAVPFPEGTLDIDTPADWRHLKASGRPQFPPALERIGTHKSPFARRAAP